MDGVAAVRAVLIADAELLAMVPAGRVMGGILPMGFSLPAIEIVSISKVNLKLLELEPTRMVTERVQVNGYAADYPAMKALMEAIERAGEQLYPEIAGISSVTIQGDGTGPDDLLDGPSIYLGSQDFKVIYTKAR